MKAKVSAEEKERIWYKEEIEINLNKTQTPLPKMDYLFSYPRCNALYICIIDM